MTGGSGFVGGRLIATLHSGGVGVTALARSEQAARAVRAAGADSVVRADLDGVAALADGMSGCDVVFHAAAYMRMYGPGREFVRVNVEGTAHALAAAKAAGVKRFVHISTEAVLADGNPIVRADERRPYPRKLAGWYPRTKALAERAALAANTLGFETIAVRPRWVWGRGHSVPLLNLVDAVKHHRFRWIDGGRYLTSTCHVANVAYGARLAAERGAGGQVYFLTDGEPVEFRAFITALLATQGVDAGAREIPGWAAKIAAVLSAWLPRPLVTRTELALGGHEVTVDDRKARRELGYVPPVSREAGLAEMRLAS
ncbi:MAG TPA: NAD-dependent epimerase/dehydratase family protein [Vicinamibacterales bacterium]|nr:NAD-dependent epimerase/dehydratase family protein [Vicinamibacterales bacterium]